MASQNKWLSYLLWFGAVYHILLGLVGIFAKGLVASLAKNFYNFNLTLDPQTYWIINPLAAYMLIFGVFMAVTATSTTKYKSFVNVILALLVLRVIQRVFFITTSPADLINNVNPIKEWMDIGLVTAYAIIVFVLSRKSKN
ncbi:MAG: hypothetical protein Q7S27_06450 [Nanoarchaeota archaeon]|nr:hypothetical protein [Nanoarchaeota archaeon]